jgi:hypothetical protein
MAKFSVISARGKLLQSLPHHFGDAQFLLQSDLLNRVPFSVTHSHRNDRVAWCFIGFVHNKSPFYRLTISQRIRQPLSTGAQTSFKFIQAFFL